LSVACSGLGEQLPKPALFIVLALGRPTVDLICSPARVALILPGAAGLLLRFCILAISLYQLGLSCTPLSQVSVAIQRGRFHLMPGFLP
jgi:hypothetical protein